LQASRPLFLLLVALALGACSSAPPRSPTEPGVQATGRSPAKPGGYYKDDGPGDNPPDLDRITDAQPKAERLHRFANNPYQVFGRDYVPMRTSAGFRERGMASWYGRRYHGQKTSNGEIYDMYAMTAAHPTLPIPSYARVTNATTGRTVVVRVNDRGPFLSDRVIDLSYVAAYKLGYIQAGSTLVDVEAISSDGDTVAAFPMAAPKPSVPVTPPVIAPEAVQLPSSTDQGGIYLQLGAFSVRENAEAFKAKLYKDLDWLGESMRVDSQGAVHRLQLGPYRTQEDARLMAERIRTQLNLQPVLLVR
jgi:rare lipoprotein A